MTKLELYFSLEEMGDLLFALGMDGKVAGDTTREIGKALIGYMRRREQLDLLLSKLAEERPSVKW